MSPSNWGSARTRSLKIAGSVVGSGVEGEMPRCWRKVFRTAFWWNCLVGDCGSDSEV